MAPLNSDKKNAISGLKSHENDLLCRTAAKKAFYAMLYGTKTAALERDLGLTERGAAEVYRMFTEKYPKTAEFVEKCCKTAVARGFVETLGGRRRPFVAGEGRTAVNALFKSSCAELLKRGVASVGDRCEALGLAARLAVLVHDEAVYEVGRAYVGEFVVF